MRPLSLKVDSKCLPVTTQGEYLQHAESVRNIACPNCVWSCDVLDDQFLGWSCAIFPGSRAAKSRDMLGAGRSHDESCDGSCDRFPRSRVLEIT